MGSPINKMVMTAKNVSLHNSSLTIRPMTPVSRHLLCVSQTLKLSKTKAREAGISSAQLFPAGLLLLSTSPSLVKGLIPCEWSRLEILEPYLLIPFLLTFKCYTLCTDFLLLNGPHASSTWLGVWFAQDSHLWLVLTFLNKSHHVTKSSDLSHLLQ